MLTVGQVLLHVPASVSVLFSVSDSSDDFERLIEITSDYNSRHLTCMDLFVFENDIFSLKVLAIFPGYHNLNILVSK